ncbi:hypothetical protein [Streptomyces sp. NPDC053048]|uniref:hypothetical protein n=1 Tax=Streptomyces sp. NPDC053048 TaxID=3365694 RepID=UPI0037D44FF2
MTRNNLTSNSNNTPSTTYTTASFVPTQGRLVLAFVMSGGPAGGYVPPATPTAADTSGLTWNPIGSGRSGGGSRVQLTGFRAMSSSAVGPRTLTFTFPTHQGFCAWSVFEYDGVDTSGTNGSGAVAGPSSHSYPTGTTVDSGRTPTDRITVGAIALDEAVTSIATGTGADQIHKESSTGFASGKGLLQTQERPASASQSLRWTWSPPANAATLILELRAATAGPPDSDRELLRQFEPILFMYPQESFFPSDAKRYIEHCALWKARAPFDVKDAWGEAGSFPRSPMIPRDKISASPGEPGTPLDSPDNLVDTAAEERFLELGGWKDKLEAAQQGVTSTSVHPYADRGQIFARYNSVTELKDSQNWYHGEVFDAVRLRTLLQTVPEKDILLPILSGMKNPKLVCYYLFYPAHEQTSRLTGTPCDNVEEREVGACGGAWACIALMLEREDDNASYAPSYIGFTGERIIPAIDSTVRRPHAFDDAERISLTVERWQPAGVSPVLPEVVSNHPRIHVARGSHSMSMTPGVQLGLPYQDGIEPQVCGKYDTASLIPPNPEKPTFLEDLAVVIAKMAAGGLLHPIGAVVGFFAGVAERFEGGLTLVGEHDRAIDDPEYPAAGSGRTIKPADVNLPEFGNDVKDWTSREFDDAQGRHYDFVVDRSKQKWWPGDPGTPPSGFHGRWGPRVENDPLGRRAGMRFPDFWKMFFLAIADGKAKSQL